MVPLRGIFEALQADVLYSAPTRSIKATKGSTVVELTLGSRQALINGETVYLDVPADTLGGRTMVPLRFVSESLGADVKWNGMSRTVLLSSGGSVENPQQPMQGGEKPRLDQVMHSATRRLGPGDSFDVVVTGDSGAEASFEILGSIRSQPMQEVRPGRYERRFVIPNGLTVQRGVLVAHLVKNGQESTAEAKRPLTIAGSGSSQGGATSVSPQPNSTVNTNRPTISVQFAEPYRQNSLRLYLDQVELNPDPNSGRQQQAEFTPKFNLSPGTHQVQAEAMSRNGQKMSTQWSFQVMEGQNNNNNNVSGLTLDNVSDGNRMPVQFDVLGSANAGSSVTLTVTYPKNSLGGVLTGQQDQFSVAGTVDNSGRYRIPLHIGAVPVGSRFNLTVTDPRSGTSVTRSLFRQ